MRCGEWDVGADIELNVPQDRFVESISRHPNRQSKSEAERLILKNNIALLHLKKEFKLGEHLNTVCLPERPLDRDNNYEKSNCVAMGWGKRAEDDADQRGFQRLMKEVNGLNIPDNDECQRLLKANTGLGGIRNWELDSSALCALGEPGVDTCEGDGGGPLVCPDPNSTEDR